jgi:Fe-S-cluster containining protein
MSEKDTKSPPAVWGLPALWENLIEQMQTQAALQGMQLSPKRIRFQVEQDNDCLEMIGRFSRADGPERVEMFRKLLERGGQACEEPLPVCVKCGECCRKASPTLHAQDLAFVRAEQIPVSRLVTLRKGEPAWSPWENRTVQLEGERIKVREKPGTSECVFLDAGTDLCGIYKHRPWQCRSQACWDPALAQKFAEQPSLTRSEILGGVEALITLILEHDERCSYEKLQQAIGVLEESEGKDSGPITEAVAFEDHFRHFVAEKLNLPGDSLDFFFGRSFAELVETHGLRVEQDADGKKMIVPLNSEDQKEPSR